MRLWIFHPLIFYPLAVLLTALVVIVGIRPQAWPRPPAPVAGEISGDTLVLEGTAFDTPSPSPGQHVTVTRDFWGAAQTLRIAQVRGAPDASDPGASILLAREQAARLSGKPTTVEVEYRPVAINAADALAVSLTGEGGGAWVAQPAPPLAGRLRFDLPAQTAVGGIALRAASDSTDQSYGIEIVRIRVTPAA